MKKNIVVSQDLVSNLIQPPDYFLKKGTSKLKDVVSDTAKLGANIINPIKNPYKAEDFKTKFGAKTSKVQNVMDKVGLGIVATVAPVKAVQSAQNKNKISAIDEKLKKSGNATTEISPLSGSGIVPTTDIKPVDIVSSVSGIKGTPLISNTTSDMNLRDKLKNISEALPAGLKNQLKDQGQQLINNKLSGAQKNIADKVLQTLPKTKAVKDAEELLNLPTKESKQLAEKISGEKQSSMLPGMFPSWVIVVLILAVLGYFFFKK